MLDRTRHQFCQRLCRRGAAIALLVFAVACSDAAAGPGAEPPVPETTGGEMPRTYAGYTLGDPPPAGLEPAEAAPAFYPDAQQYIVRLGESPRVRVALLVHDGTIFRIEYRVQDEDLDREKVAAAFAERLGPPDDSQWLPDHVAHWDDGLKDGSTAVSVMRTPKSEWLKVIVEDVARGVQLLRTR